MTRIPSLRLPAADTPSLPDSAAASAPETRGADAAGAAGGTIDALKMLATYAKRPRGAVTARRGETVERLGRLRAELSRIAPPPDSAEAARDAILAAMARAGLEGWTVPELHDAATLAYQDGSKRIDLISHGVVFNPWGAFRIVDLRAGAAVYFELAGAGPREFAAPRERRPLAAPGKPAPRTV
ncbi:hypothetical protein [Burkholderia sp. Ac-20379]|uniref:hypothetical protein n=1 Tax=Burkholderia sp. Ac-20379 TaxID=2703900 RepID=UPI0019809600|nr:hypothetical protein [Burkholderia sp. Ac-20379]MBN3725922.1 hypothetical protein [Burkholderia sp. Ac-20379]